MSRKQNKFDTNDFDDGDNIESLLREFELGLPDDDDAFFDIELESLEEYLDKVNIKNGSNK